MVAITSLADTKSSERSLVARILGPRIVDAWTFAPQDVDEMDVRADACTVSSHDLTEPERSHFEKCFGVGDVAFDPYEVSAYRPLPRSRPSEIYVFINEHRYVVEYKKDALLPYKRTRGTEEDTWEFCEVSLGKGGVQRIPVKRFKIIA